MDGNETKEIILVNKAKCCKECEFYFRLRGVGRCMLNSALAEKDKRPDWCPRIPVPKRKELSCDDWEHDSRAKTWNYCIDAITGMQDKKRRQQGMELEVLNAIAFMTSKEFAKQAAFILDSKKHTYDFERYLYLLGRLQELISAGIPNDIALDIAQIDIPIDIFISSYKPANAVDGK